MIRSLAREPRRILLLLYATEAGLSLFVLGLYEAKSYGLEALQTKAGACALAGGSVFVASAALLLSAAASSGNRRAFALGLAVNAFSVLVAVATAEAIVRSTANWTPAGIRVGGVRLLPTWPELVARSRAAIAGANPSGSWDESFLVRDRDLGWTVGPNRHDRTGRYISSHEGIRSGAPGFRFAGRKARYRVALVGDSNAFSLEVPFAESWGSQLETMLGKDVQVLNFGVDGYGVDQIYLRYQRDVRPWHPDAVVVGFMGDDLLRSMAVYPFVSFEWPGFIVKPRFVLENGRLRQLNDPLPEVEQVLSEERIRDLPFVEFDVGYASSWGWRPPWSPMLARLVVSAAHWRFAGPVATPADATGVNRELFASLHAFIESDGSMPIFVEMSDVGAREPLVDQTLSDTPIHLVDLTPCLTKVPEADRRVASGYHFTGAANRAIASCTVGPIATALETARQYPRIAQ